MDDVVGNLMKKLDELGISDNTIIVQMGDNGFYLGEHGMAGKWYAHEESIRVPLIIHDPRLSEKERGKRLDQMALNIDVAPTLLSFAGVEIPAAMQGKDLTLLYSGDQVQDNWRDEFFYEHTIDLFPDHNIPKSIAVIGDEYKLITYTELESGFEEFYNRKEDPREKNNLIDEPAYLEVIGEYREKMVEMQDIVI